MHGAVYEVDYSQIGNALGVHNSSNTNSYMTERTNTKSHDNDNFTNTHSHEKRNSLVIEKKETGFSVLDLHSTHIKLPNKKQNNGINDTNLGIKTAISSGRGDPGYTNDKVKAIESLKNVDLNSLLSSISFDNPTAARNITTTNINDNSHNSSEANNNNYNSSSNNMNNASNQNLNQDLMSLDFLSQLPSKNRSSSQTDHLSNSTIQSIDFTTSSNHNKHRSDFISQSNTLTDFNANLLGGQHRKSVELNNLSNILLSTHNEDRFDPNLIMRQLRGAIIVYTI